MQEFIYGLIVFFAITGIWSYIIIQMLKKYRGKKVNTSGLTFIFILLMLIGAAILAAWALVDYHKEPEFCGLTCHPMVPYYDTYLDPMNNIIMISHLEKDVVCVDCHTGEGIIGQVEAVVIDGTKDLVHLILGDYDPDNMHGFVPSENCLKGCHDDLDWKFEAPVPRGSTHETAADGTTVWPTRMIWHPYTMNGTDFSGLEEMDTCVNCHDQRMNGIGFTRDACPICHDVSPSEINVHRDQTCGMGDCHVEPEFIGHRLVMDNCMFCHDRMHPKDARVPYEIAQAHGIYKVNSTFCSACHLETYNSLVNSDSGHGWEDGCPECHGEHKYWPACSDCHSEANIPHIVTGSYSECHACHERGAHDPQNITHDVNFQISNGFCSECHTDATATFNNGAHLSQRCVNCHGNDHGTISVDFDYCNGCHVGLPGFHDETTDGCACHDLAPIHRP
ncbi:MAG: hypothetical protein KAS67_02635 [Thermoplasmata archaeon]|nr:hypothetical protein [Thermoplasmata archaeon]